MRMNLSLWKRKRKREEEEDWSPRHPGSVSRKERKERGGGGERDGVWHPDPAFPSTSKGGKRRGGGRKGARLHLYSEKKGKGEKRGKRKRKKNYNSFCTIALSPLFSLRIKKEEKEKKGEEREEGVRTAASIFPPSLKGRGGEKWGGGGETRRQNS